MQRRHTDRAWPFPRIFYTAVRHWNPGQIGILIASQSLAGVAVQSLVGHWIDESHHKKLVTAAAGLLTAAAALGIVLLPSFWLQIVVQVVIGVSVTVFPAVTSAFALGMVEEGQFSKRIARNESFTHGGDVVFASAAAAIFFTTNAF